MIAIIAVLIALLLPAVQSACGRASRPVHEQLETNLSPGGHELRVGQPPPPPAACSSIDQVKGAAYYRDNFSSFVRLLPYTEQSPMYNCVNFHITYANVENFTVAGVQLAALVCPSDINNGPQYINTGQRVQVQLRRRPDHEHRTFSTSPRTRETRGRSGRTTTSVPRGARRSNRNRMARSSLTAPSRSRASPTGPAIRSSTARRPTGTSRIRQALSKLRHSAGTAASGSTRCSPRPIRRIFPPRARPGCRLLGLAIIMRLMRQATTRAG